ncbi:MAG: methyltransferase domain-containing protein [Desulfovibrionales bacterium]|nr:methyltransferase domain-containing protein [Desulfovibrionales bacterium]
MSPTSPTRQSMLDALYMESLALENPFAFQDSYHLADFAPLEGEDFVTQAYYAVLKRPPDPHGLTTYTRGLADGQYTKVYILGALRYSAEGRSHGVTIHGLRPRLPFHLARCKVMGLVLRRLELPISRTRRRVATLERELRSLRQRSASLHELDALRQALTGTLHNRQALHRVLEHRLAGAHTAPRPSAQTDGSFYMELEARFRGTEQDITAGLACFIPWIEQMQKACGTAALAVDLGSGRGEWLGLLRELRVPALGVDLNPLFVDQCRAKGLEVREADALEFLAAQPDASLGLVSAFHMLEHLDFSTQYRMLAETFRVLQPGGLALFETPNPRNILVGAGDFYRDPTHANPIFPDTLALLGEHLGFASSAAYFFQKDRVALDPCAGYPFDSLDDYVRVSRDFVWRGVKP